MKVTLIVPMLLTSLFLNGFVIAADKVIVIPVMKSATNNTSSDPWIRLYDANDKFIGFTYSLNISTNSGGVLSTKGYYTTCIGCDEPIATYFLTDNCTGTVYSQEGDYRSLIRENGRLREHKGNTYYSKPDTSFTLTAGTPHSIWMIQQGCNPFPSGTTVDLELYELFPNDPAVTGFLDSADYAHPFKMIYNLPSIP